MFPFVKNRICKGIEEVLEAYRKVVKKVTLSGPTSFAPLIREACRRVDEEGTYCILIIVADGKVSDNCKQVPLLTHSRIEAWFQDTADAIVEATKYPLSIVMVVLVHSSNRR